MLGSTVGKLSGLARAASAPIKMFEKPAKDGHDNASRTAAESGSDDGYIPLKSRLSAWWNGTDIGLSGDNRSGQSIDVDKSSLAEANVWTPERFRVVQNIWGEGYMEPGGSNLARKILTPANVDGKHTVLDLTAKLGGTATLIAKDANLWMEAYESDPDLAQKANQYINMFGLGQRIPLQVVDYNKIEMTNRKYDLIYSRERLFSIENKKSLIEKIGEALKTKGQFLFTDYMISNAEEHKQDIATWIGRERHDVFPWTMELYIAVLQNFGFKVWSTADLTDEFLQQIHNGWHKMAKSVEIGEFDRKHVDYLMQEGEIWLTRARAIEAGALKIKRIQAMSPHAEG